MTTAEKNPDDGRLVAPLWDVREDMVVSGVMYVADSVVRSWILPLDSRLKPLNANARLLAMYALKVRHHPAKPKSASTRFGLILPAVLVFGGSSTGCLVEGGEHDGMPRFEHSGVVLTWPGTYVTKYDRPANEPGELLLHYMNENRDHPELEELHSCWCCLRDELWLPRLSKRERPESERLPPYYGGPKPAGYVASDSRPDSTLVPSRPVTPTIRTRRIAETHAAMRPSGRR